MSEIKLYLLDSHTCISATVHGSVGDALVAALSAEPETVDELESALSRFQKCTSIPASSLHRSERCEIDETQVLCEERVKERAAARPDTSANA
jgi:hypothetical protein